MECPVCNKEVAENIEIHVEKCIFLHTQEEPTMNDKNKRRSHTLEAPEKRFKENDGTSTSRKSPVFDNKRKVKDTNNGVQGTNFFKTNKVIQLSDDDDDDNDEDSQPVEPEIKEINKKKLPECDLTKPLAEIMRPDCIDQYIGQQHVLGSGMVLRTLLEKTEIPSMILWGPPGCGKTTLAHIIASKCKQSQSVRFVKLSATMAGVNDVKKIIEVAKNEQKFKRRTILFMDEIHRFNKLQQDTFLPHVESGVITLIGATTENPSFSLNNALLSRCRVIVLQKLEVDNLMQILTRALGAYKAVIIENSKDVNSNANLLVERASIKWLAEMCDGDARIALNSLQLAVQSLKETSDKSKPSLMTVENIKDGIKRSHMLYDSKGDQHYDTISALHKSIRASDDNAALYWCTRMLKGGDDPRFIARRLMRAASEDIGLADPHALSLAVAAAQGAQLIGMPECDVLLAQCAVYLARAPKSQEVYRAMLECGSSIENCRGNLPPVPLHLRNAPTKLMKELGYGKGYNMRHKDESNLTYMPEGMENVSYF
ncbi:ATPase WRNIP1-like [Ctenocephalides felis]|uniref:ATPase WRNIP1-like n=1 Tax=Ctenocephalides felis TaxID=7515 RepID=UPI000E6E4D46|nr:ATPase WRNIP1-like [Ctenocephalides felis]